MMLLTDADMPIRQGELAATRVTWATQLQTFALAFGICKASRQ